MGIRGCERCATVNVASRLAEKGWPFVVCLCWLSLMPVEGRRGQRRRLARKRKGELKLAKTAATVLSVVSSRPEYYVIINVAVSQLLFPLLLAHCTLKYRAKKPKEPFISIRSVHRRLRLDINLPRLCFSLPPSIHEHIYCAASGCSSRSAPSEGTERIRMVFVCPRPPFQPWTAMMVELGLMIFIASAPFKPNLMRLSTCENPMLAQERPGGPSTDQTRI